MKGKKIISLMLTVFISIMILPIQTMADEKSTLTLNVGEVAWDGIVYIANTGEIAADLGALDERLSCSPITEVDEWIISRYGPIEDIPPISDGEYFYMGRIKWYVIGESDSKWFAIAYELQGENGGRNKAFQICLDVYRSFSTAEQDSLLDIYKSEQFEVDGIEYASELDTIVPAKTCSSPSKVFLPSLPEALYYFSDDYDRQLHAYDNDWMNFYRGWWLRSGNTPNGYKTWCVQTFGELEVDSFMTGHGCRPVFVLDRTSVLFTSAAEGGKSSGADGSSFGSFLDGGSGAKKLTLLDSRRNGFSASIADSSSSTVTSAGVIDISYSGARTGSQEYVSAMLCNSNGNIIGYASITPDGSGAGTWEMILPELEAGTYVLKVFSEQQNGDTETDYASPISTIELTVIQKNTKNTVTGTNVALGDELGLNFYLAVPEETVASGAKVVMNGPKGELEVLLSEAPKDGDEYKLTYRVNAVQADSDITLKIVDSNNITLELFNSVGTEYENGIKTYSVNRYLVAAMQYDGITDKEPIRATYTYCAYAAKWKNGTEIPTDGYINELMMPSVDALDAFKVVKTNTSETIKITGCSLVLDSKTAIRLYFTSSDDINNHDIKVGDKTLTPVLSGNKVDNLNEYYVEITGIGAGKLETQYTVVFDQNSDNYQVSVSAMSYVRNILRQKDKYPDICTEDLCNLVTAIYAYAEEFK